MGGVNGAGRGGVRKALEHACGRVNKHLCMLTCRRENVECWMVWNESSAVQGGMHIRTMFVNDFMMLSTCSEHSKSAATPSASIHTPVTTTVPMRLIHTNVHTCGHVPRPMVTLRQWLTLRSLLQQNDHHLTTVRMPTQLLLPPPARPV